MSFNFGAPKTTGGSFSFPTLTTSTAGGSGALNFSAGLTSQATGSSPFSFGTTSTPATGTTQATTTAPSLFTTITTTQQSAVPSGGFLATPASSSTSTFSFSAPTTSTNAGFSCNFQLPTNTSAPTVTPTLQFGGPTKPLGGALEPPKTTVPTMQSFAFPAKTAAGTSLFPIASTTTSTVASTPATTATAVSLPTATFPSLAIGQTSTPATITTTLGLAAPVATTTTIGTSAVTTSTKNFACLTTATSTSSATIAPPVSGAPTAGLSVAGLEEKVNKWMSELREQEERLMRQAAHVNAWDQLLQQGHDQVQQLRLTLNNVKTDQNRLQAELDFIQGQQQELEQLIEPLEAAAASTTPAQHQGDRQRENMHLVAQNLDSQLRQITDDLCKVIEHLNSSNSGSRATDPVNTVARVLSAHMDTLKWVDQNTALLSQKIDELSRNSENKRKN